MNYPLNIVPLGQTNNIRRKSFEDAQDLALKYTTTLTNCFHFKILNYFFLKEECFKLYSKKLFRELYPITFEINRALNYNLKQPITIENSLIFNFLSHDPRYSNLNFKLVQKPINLLKTAKFIFGFFIDIFNIFKLQFFIPLKSKNNIAVEINEGLESVLQRSEINWLKHTSLNNFIFIINDVNITEINKEELKLLPKQIQKKHSIVSRHKSLRESIGALYFTPPPERIFPTFFFLNGFYASIFSWILIYIYWFIFYKKFKIKIFVGVNEFPISNILQRFALNRLKGKYIIRQRSETTSLLGHQYQPGDIGFFWSQNGLEHFNFFGNDIKYGQSLGHSFLDSDNIYQYIEKAKEIRSKLSNNNKDAIIYSLFDNVHGENYETTTQELVSIFSILISKLKNNQNTFLILKSKKKDSLIPFLNKSDRQFLENSNQIYFLFGNILPTILIMASDLSIGLGASSSIWEANILGLRGVHFWSGPNKDHTLASTFSNNILVDNIATLNKIINLSKDELTESQYGLVEKKYIHHFDTFHDGRGPKRIAEMIEIIYNNISLSDSQIYQLCALKYSEYIREFEHSKKLYDLINSSAILKSSIVSISTEDLKSIK